MWPASPKTSGLLVLPLFLLLLALHAPQAQGRPLTTTYFPLFQEIEAILNKPPVPSEDPLSLDEIFILRNKSFLRMNMDTFLNATKHFTDGDKIRTILEEFKEVLPISTSTEDPISIETGNWGDFRRKLKEYLCALRKWVFRPTSNPSRPSEAATPLKTLRRRSHSAGPEDFIFSSKV